MTTTDRAGRLRLGLALAGAAVLIAAIVVAVLAQRRVADLEGDLTARDAVTAAAARFGEVYLTYDAQDVAGSKEAVLDLATDGFAEDFESTRAPGIDELFANLGTSTEATTTAVYVGERSEERAEVLVVVDIVATSDATGTQRLTDLAFLLELRHEGERWLVDEVRPAPQPDVSGDGVEPPPTSTPPTSTAP